MFLTLRHGVGLVRIQSVSERYLPRLDALRWLVPGVLEQPVFELVQLADYLAWREDALVSAAHVTCSSTCRVNCRSGVIRTLTLRGGM